ncbi:MULTISPECIES: DNA-binding protein [Mammaliicoccus]|uniref:DNA-binding protein n=1 Tax=Mammaliicoccus lentus TaxID=42858 RepID=A0AAX3W5V1_MAMLE|nr:MULTISPECIES: DNA-binding protein [Mammaliicoccus]MBW0766895.1 DNA-binding protein [Mammaliicoccus lentus]WHI60668.1 DNA-binding protein [Mammaliicoccus lentus]
MKSKMLILSLIIVFSIVLVACSNGNEEKKGEDGKIVLSPKSSDIKGKVLFDSAHGQTAGSADWVIDGGFSDFADALTKENYEVTDLGYNQLLDYKTMQDYQLVVIPEANNPLKKSEQDAIEKYVKSGGSILMISDHYNADRNFNRFDSSEVMNGYRRGAFDNPTKGMSPEESASEKMKGVESRDFLNEVFGLRFRYNALGNVKVDDIASSEESFNITNGIKAVSMHAGSTIAITDPNKAKGIAFVPQLSKHDKWNNAVDEGIYNGGGKNEGPYIAISKVEKGKGAFIGDSSMVEDKTPKYKREDNGENKKTYDGFKEEDNKKMVMQIVEWLNKQENQKDFKAMDINLDDKTPLKRFEQPENSQEVEQEPWGTPKRGYKWYDASTYASGSYGAKGTKQNKTEHSTEEDNNTTNNDTSTFDIPSSISRQEKFNITVHVDESKLINQKFQLSIKNKDGREVGMFNGQAPGISESVNPKIKNGKTDWYFKTKIANEADEEVKVEVLSGGNVIAQTTLTVE